MVLQNWKRTDPPREAVQIGALVSGTTWTDSARLLSYVRGFGNQVVPQNNPAADIGQGVTRLFHYRVSPSPVAITRIWGITLHRFEPSRLDQPGSFVAGSRVLIQINDLAPVVVEVESGSSELPLFGINAIAIREDLARKREETVEDVVVSIQNVSPPDAEVVRVEGIECWELPRPQLSLDQVDRGIDLRSLEQAQPIFKGDAVSLGGLAESWEATRTVRHLVNHAHPVVSTTSESFQPVFALPFIIRPSRDQNSDRRFVDWSVQAQADAGTVGQVRVRTASGVVSDAETINAVEGRRGNTIPVFNENFASDLGIPAFGEETIQVEFRRQAGSGAVRLFGFTVLENRAQEAAPSPPLVGRVPRSFTLPEDGENTLEDISDEFNEVGFRVIFVPAYDSDAPPPGGGMILFYDDDNHVRVIDAFGQFSVELCVGGAIFSTQRFDFLAGDVLGIDVDWVGGSMGVLVNGEDVLPRAPISGDWSGISGGLQIGFSTPAIGTLNAGVITLPYSRALV